MQLRVQIGQRDVNVELEPVHGSGYRVSFDKRVHIADLVPVGPSSLYSLLLDGVAHEVLIQEKAGALTITIGDQQFTARVQAGRAPPTKVSPASLVAPDEQQITAPMPGLVVSILVLVGDRVEARAPLIVVESMKMHNQLRAPAAGRVATIYVQQGQRVDRGQVLMVVA